VRAAIQHNLAATPCRLWYGGAMFRYERPQKGRQRQFHQIGAELFGHATPDADAELIALLARLWRELGIADAVRLELNSIGSAAARATYREALVAYLRARGGAGRGQPAPARQQSPAHPRQQEPVHAGVAGRRAGPGDFLDDESQEDFAILRRLLEAAGVEYTVNPRLVRGLDYYNKTVFEWVTDALGAQGTVCAGGRYDGLFEQLGGRPTPGVGFAMGVERLVLMLHECAALPAIPVPALYAVPLGDDAQRAALRAVEDLRRDLPGMTDTDGPRRRQFSQPDEKRRQERRAGGAAVGR
jgi:histidyl-tRNA synthetase